MTIDTYTNLITSQHKTKPKFMAWLSATLQKADDTVEMTKGIPTAFDIDWAVGPQLDILGIILGRSRQLPFQPSSGSAPTLDDTNYQIALKAKIAQNQWDGTIPSIYKIWNSLFTDLTLNIVDNQNMTMSVLINGQISAVINEMIAAGYIVPKPAGVGLTIIEVTNLSENQYVSGMVTTNETITISS
jgi:hypothetical protein